MERTRPPAAYWVICVAVLAALGAALNALYQHFFDWWGVWNLSDANAPGRVALLVGTAAIYAGLLYLVYTKAARIMQPFINLVRFVGDVWTELQRVVWPSHEDTYAFTVVVIIAVLVVALWVGVLDMICGQVMSGLFR